MSEPYRPSNGSSGDWFESQFCNRCEKDRKYREYMEKNEVGPQPESCGILGAALTFETEHEYYPKEWIEDENGPKCTAFEHEIQPNPEKPEYRPAEDTLTPYLFSELESSKNE